MAHFLGGYGTVAVTALGPDILYAPRSQPGRIFLRKIVTVRAARGNCPPECLSVTEAEVAVKRTETMKPHYAFQEKLEKCLGNSGEAWTPFLADNPGDVPRL